MRPLFAIVILAGCAPARPASGPVALSVEAAAQRNGVPRDLMLAIAAVEGGLTLPKHRLVRDDDEVPVGGVLELRHGKLDTLRRGAELMGTDENALRADTDLGTEAGARVLAELGRNSGARSDDLDSWSAAVENLSGLGDTRARSEYVTSVYAILHDGGLFPARGGEAVTLSAHPEVHVPEPASFQQAANGTPDYPGATWFTTSCTDKCTIGRPDGNDSVDLILIHDTEGGWVGSVATLQYDLNKSVHYIIDKDGSRVGQFRHETDTTWHAGNFEYNKHSVGIEHVGVAADPSGYQTALYDKSVALVESIRSRWPNIALDRKHIVGHYQVPDGTQIAEGSPPCALTLDQCETSPSYGGRSNHRDPGYYWQWCQYMEKLGGSCTCNDAYASWNCTSDKTEAVRCTDGKVEIAHCDKGCEVMPIGTEDVCHQSVVTPGPTDMADLAGPIMNPQSGGGCSVGGAPAPDGLLLLALGLVIVAAARRLRRI